MGKWEGECRVSATTGGSSAVRLRHSTHRTGVAVGPPIPGGGNVARATSTPAHRALRAGTWPEVGHARGRSALHGTRYDGRVIDRRDAPGSDALPRCWWAAGEEPRDPLMVAYHDEEWGVPVHDDTALFERLALESFQAGLSWSTILHKREAFRAAFAGFDPTVVAAFNEADRSRLLADAGIVRNRAKIDAAIGNAAGVVAIQAEHGALDAYLWRFVGGAPRRLPPSVRTWADVPPMTPGSEALSADLKGRGFRFVGPTVVYAFMQSVGMVDDHLPGCFRYGGAG